MAINYVKEFVYADSYHKFKSHPVGGLILPSLLDWLQWHFPEGKHMALEVSQAEIPSDHENYWPAVSA